MRARRAAIRGIVFPRLVTAPESNRPRDRLALFRGAPIVFSAPCDLPHPQQFSPSLSRGILPDMIRRYIFNAGLVSISAGAATLTRELWIGFSIDSDGPLDLERFSRAHGYDLIGADDLTADELASVGVVNFPHIDLGTCDREVES